MIDVYCCCGCCCSCCCAVEGNNWTAWRAITKCENIIRASQRTKTMWGFPGTWSPQRDGTQHNPLTKRASSTTLNAQRTATELGRDPDMYRNIHTPLLLAPQRKAREKTLGRRRTSCQNKKCTFLQTFTPPRGKPTINTTALGCKASAYSLGLHFGDVSVVTDLDNKSCRCEISVRGKRAGARSQR